MEINSVRVVRYDFYRRRHQDQVDASLQEVFENKTELHPQTLEFGETDIETNSTLYTDATDQIQSDLFESIQTFLIADPIPRYFFHTLTIATLTAEEQNQMDVGDPMGNRTRREDWATEIESIASAYGSSLIQSEGPAPVIILVEPTLDSLPSGEQTSFDPIHSRTVSEMFDQYAGTLDTFGFYPTEHINTIDNSYILTFHRDQVIDFPLSILVTREQVQLDGENPVDYWRSWIGFGYTRIKSVTSILMMQHWLIWRRQEIKEIDQELYGYDLRDTRLEDLTAELRNEEQQLEQLRRKWVESHSAAVDEFHDIQELVECYQRGDEDTVFDVAMEKGDRSYLHKCLSCLDSEFEIFSATLERVETKLEMFISVVQDRIQSSATESNLELQSTVTNLTILLAVIAVIEFGLDHLSKDIFLTVTQFVAQSGILLAGMVLLTVGFILGYTHT